MSDTRTETEPPLLSTLTPEERQHIIDLLTFDDGECPACVVILAKLRARAAEAA